MNSIKITFDGVEKEISLGIDSEEIESNDNISSDTIDLTKLDNVSFINCLSSKFCHIYFNVLLCIHYCMYLHIMLNFNY